MLRPILTALTTAMAASRMRGVARDAAYGVVALSAGIIALLFLSVAAFFWLSEPLGQAGAAAAVCAMTASLSAAVVLWTMKERRDAANDNGGINLPAMLGLDGRQDLEGLERIASMQIKQAGPLKIAFAALAAGFLLAKLR